MIAETVRELGLEVRSGLHTGECEVMNAKVGGIAVHVGARVATSANPSEVLVCKRSKTSSQARESRSRTAGPMS
jgi:class 3 adenylate cyclase